MTHIQKPGGFEMEIDLGAEGILAAERANQKIAIEVKTFTGLLKIYDLYLQLANLLIIG